MAKDQQNLPYDVSTTVGRQYVQWGTGLALSMPLDAVVVGAELNNLEVKGLYGRTIPTTLNFDQSEPVANHEDRDFYGVQATYKGFKDHQPFAYYLWQHDQTKALPTDPDQDFLYDSQYLGVGSTGKLGLRNLYYQTELAWEHGHDFGSGATPRQGEDQIAALAYDANVNYLFQSPHRPEVSAEYLFASGSPDRMNPTNTIGGNQPGQEDYGFNGFGFRNTGLSFAPPISNMNMFRVGGDFRPFPTIAA